MSVLLCVSASHKTASFELLERLSVPSTPVAPLIAAHDECVQGAVVVATCNRFEAYVDMDEPVTAAVALGIDATLGAIEAATGVPASELEGSYTVLGGDDVAEHLFSVASGLESVVVGEGEIAGQVRRSLEQARREGTTTPELERLFQRASQTSRRVKNETGIGGEGRSLVRLALDLAESRVSDWAQTRVLLVGTGRFAGASLAALRDRGVTDVRDRCYFQSIYFREPGGVLFEVATVQPGFTVDEDLASLGRDLKLPPWEEPNRKSIEAGLPKVDLPGSQEARKPGS